MGGGVCLAHFSDFTVQGLNQLAESAIEHGFFILERPTSDKIIERYAELYFYMERIARCWPFLLFLLW